MLKQRVRRERVTVGVVLDLRGVGTTKIALADRTDSGDQFLQQTVLLRKRFKARDAVIVEGFKPTASLVLVLEVRSNPRDINHVKITKYLGCEKHFFVPVFHRCFV